MNSRSVANLLCFALLSLAMPWQAPAEDFTSAIHAYLQHCINATQANIGVVVGIVDEQGSRVVGYGKPDNGAVQEVNGDTLFEIGSDTKTFTALLLQDMIARGGMKLDDPVAKYLPESVQMPARNGKQITLHHLATHSSGLPVVPDNLEPQRADNPYADYTVEKLYDFLSRYPLASDPGAKSEYSNLGMGLLGHVVALNAGMNYESLVVDRICSPLKMDSTRIVLTPELKARLATPHDQFGEPVSHWDASTLAGAGGLRSTANDLLRYVSANLGLTHSDLTPLMATTHNLRLAWTVKSGPEGTKIIKHGGGTGGCRSFVGFDWSRRRGVVILSNSKHVINLDSLGDFLLQCQWHADRRPTKANFSTRDFDSYIGRYQRLPDFESRWFLMRLSRQSPRLAALSAVCCFAGFLIILWRVAAVRRRRIIAGFVALVSGLLAIPILLPSNHRRDANSEPSIGIRREGNRLFAQGLGTSSSTLDEWLPPVAAELLPETETRFFERLSGLSLMFSPDSQGHVIGFTARRLGKTFVYEKTSTKPPEPLQPLRPPFTIQLDTKLLDACVGHYEFAPSDILPPPGMKLTIWRDADQLIGQAWGKNVLPGPFNIYPQSETRFMIKINGAQLTFVKNDQGEVTSVVHNESGVQDLQGTKRK